MIKLLFDSTPVGFSEKAVRLTENKSFTIGRSTACDFTFPDKKTVSGTHCKLYLENGNVFVEDNSMNGTVINDEVTLKIGEKQKLSDGDSVCLGAPNSNGLKFVLNCEELLNATLPIDFDDSTLPIENCLETEENNEKKDETKKENKGKIPNVENAGEIPCSSKIENSEEMAENLICPICCEIIHDCIALQPCMHCFCGGCYSEWMSRSTECPECRVKVNRIAKNHMMNNVIEAYLKNNPSKKRSAEDVAELDEKNQITKDMLEPPKKKRRISSDDENEEEESEGSEESETEEAEEDEINLPVRAFGQGGVKWICRQCPGQVNNPGTTGRAPYFTCAPDGSHSLCQCCLRPMPDRSTEDNPNLPPFQCTLCSQFLCHQYWGCRGPGCRGCLAQLKDLDFGPGIWSKVLLNNRYESQILEEYFTFRGLNHADLVKECLAKLESGAYTVTQNVNSSSVVCFRCGLKVIQDLAYQYRKGISVEDLPAAATSRTDCHWGKNCRTQKTKPHHAQNFNHICDQTKFDP